MQYTIRGIPSEVDHALRKRARAAGKSLNEAAVEALAEGAGIGAVRKKRRSLRDIRTWKRTRLLRLRLPLKIAWTRASGNEIAVDAITMLISAKGVSETVSLLEEATLILPFVVLGELRAGFAHGKQRMRESSASFKKTESMSSSPMTKQRTFRLSSVSFGIKDTVPALTCGSPLVSQHNLFCMPGTNTSIIYLSLFAFDAAESDGRG
jgi:hypothetical protein